MASLNANGLVGRLIVNLVKSASDGKISGPDLITLLARPAAEGGLTTKQDPKRVLGFYRPKFKEMGVIAESEIEVEIQVEVPDKPVPPAAAAPAESAAPAEKPHKSKGIKGEQKAA